MTVPIIEVDILNESIEHQPNPPPPPPPLPLVTLPTIEMGASNELTVQIVQEADSFLIENMQTQPNTVRPRSRRLRGLPPTDSSSLNSGSIISPPDQTLTQTSSQNSTPNSVFVNPSQTSTPNFGNVNSSQTSTLNDGLMVLSILVKPQHKTLLMSILVKHQLK